MPKFKFAPILPAKVLLGALATAALVAGGTGSARAAVETFFGKLTPTSGTCSASTNGSDTGAICTSPLTFSDNGSTFTVHGYSDTFVTETALTLKDYVTQGEDESGLGENAKTATSCTDNAGAGASTPCEIGINHSVAVTSTIPIVDLIVGSVQSTERFKVYTGSDIASLTPLGGGTGTIFTGATCSLVTGTEECLFNFATPVFAVGVLDLAATTTGVASDVLLTAVSVPAPPIGHGLPVVLAIGGMLLGAKLWGRDKKNGSLGQHAAA